LKLLREQEAYLWKIRSIIKKKIFFFYTLSKFLRDRTRLGTRTKEFNIFVSLRELIKTLKNIFPPKVFKGAVKARKFNKILQKYLAFLAKVEQGY